MSTEIAHRLHFYVPVEDGLNIGVRGTLHSVEGFSGLELRARVEMPAYFGTLGERDTVRLYSDPCKDAISESVIKAEGGLSIVAKTELRLRKAVERLAGFVRMETVEHTVYEYKPLPLELIQPPVIRETVGRPLPDEYRLPIPGSGKKVLVRARAFDHAYSTETPGGYLARALSREFHYMTGFPEGWPSPASATSAGL